MTTQLFSSTPSWEEIASTLARDASDTMRLMVAIYHRFENEGADSTDIGTVLRDYFRRARWPRPTNLPATANHCAGKGWLSEAGKSEGRKFWRITRKGYDYVRSQLLETI